MTMRYFWFLLGLIFLVSCEELVDVKREIGPCTIQLANGGTITTKDDIEILKATGTITYRDEDGKLWSVTTNEYIGYTCGN